MTRRTVLLQAAVAAAVLVVAWAAALVMVSQKAEATFPGKNGKIAYVSSDGNDYEIYTINPNGGGKFQVTHSDTSDYDPCYSPDGKRIAYTG
jgi:predicted heme/steroid binding protein